MRQAVLGYEQKFFINGTQISGVQNVAGSYAIDERPINVLGWGHVNKNFYNDRERFAQPDGSFILDENGFNILGEESLDCAVDGDISGFPESMAVLNAPLEGSFSINSVLVSEDFFLQFTGDAPFTGSIHHGKKYFGFDKGYITSHTVSCGVGELPTTSTSIRVFGDIGGSPEFMEQEDEGGLFLQEDGFAIGSEDSNAGIYNASGDNPFPEIRLPNQGSIIVECAGATTDRVTSFNYGIDIPISPIYTVGSSVPAQVDVAWPVTTNTSFSLDIDKYEYQSLRKYLKSPTVHDIAIKINDCFGVPIQHYVVKSARLIGEDMAASTDGKMTVNLTYKSYYNKR